MKMSDWTPRPGELVQIWDHAYENDEELRVTGHGLLGYVVGESKQNPHVGAYRIICFGQKDDPTVGTIIDVNVDWLHQVNKSSDVKKI